MCWPANIAGAFFLAVICVDIYHKEYSRILPHSLYGTLITLVLWLICVFVNPWISAGILVIPVIFLFTVLIINEGMKASGCSISCGDESCIDGKVKKWHLRKKATASASSASDVTILYPPEEVTPESQWFRLVRAITEIKDKCIAQLTATPI